MAYEVTPRARSLFSQTTIEPNLVLKLRSFDKLLGVESIKVDAKFGEEGILFGDEGLTFGGLARILNQKDLIQLSGTSNEITQQLEPDKGAISSVQSLKVRLTDLDQEMTRLVSPGVTIPEILYEYCQIYLGPKESSFPDDYIELFNGNIQQVQSGAGYVDLTIVHPEDKKRGKLFTKIEQKLTEPLNFNSLGLQELFYQTYGDITGLVEIRYFAGTSGNNAIVTVAGQQISVAIDPLATTQKTVRRAIRASADAADIIQSVELIEGGDGDQLASTTGSFVPFVTETEISLESVSQFVLPVGDLLRTYVQIGDEIIEYTGIDTALNKLTGCTRASLNSFGEVHEIGATVSSFYKLGDATQENGNAVDLALKLMLSGAKEFYADNLSIESIVEFDLATSIPNALFIKKINVARDLGVTIGDSATVFDASNLANNFVDRKVTGFDVTENGSYIQVDGPPLVIERPSTAKLRLKSRFNVLPDGLELEPFQVDIERFEQIKALYFSSIALYEFYLKDTQEAKELINEKIYLPSSMYSVPRKGRISVGFTAPPLFAQTTKTLDISTVKNPDRLVVDRSTTKNFYNSVVYRYNEDSVTDKFLSGRITVSQDSINRIAIPNQPLTITASGLRDNAETALLVERNSLRFLQRYQFGAERLVVEVPFAIGWDVEVGDPIVLGGDALQVSDSTRGDRNFAPRIFEITNKRINWRTGFVSLEVTDTSFNQEVRFGVWSPASNIVSGTTSSIIIQDSFGTAFPLIERDKWAFYIGKQILIHSPDWTQQATSRIIGFSGANDYEMLIEPITFAPSSGYVVRLPYYDQITENDSLVLKQIHPFWTPQLVITNVISPTVFEVSLLDASRIFVDAVVRVHSDDYVRDSGLTARRVVSISGQEITVTDLGFTPLVGDKIDLIGFVSDNGAPYAWI